MTNQDINNLKRKFLHLNESVEQKVFSLLNQFVQVDANNVACVVLDDEEKGIELMFLQSNSQRECFKKFPELILLDGTYKINHAGMALYDVLVEDGCGNSRIVAYCFVTQETYFRYLRNIIQGGKT